MTDKHIECCLVCNLNDMIQEGMDIEHQRTIKCSQYTVASFEVSFSGAVIHYYITRDDVVSMVRDEMSMVHQYVKTYCLELIDPEAARNYDDYELIDVLLKQSTDPIVLTISFKYTFEKENN